MNVTVNTSDNSTLSKHHYYLLPVLSIISLDVMFGNMLILVSILRFRLLRTKSNILVGNLAISDLLVGIIVIPYEIVILLVKDFVLHKYACLFRQTLAILFLGAAVWSVFCLSMERYIAIVHPFLYRRKCSAKSLLLCVVLSWSVATVIGILPVLGWNKWQPAPTCNSRYVLHIEYNGIVDIIYTCAILINFCMFIKIVFAVWNYMSSTTLDAGVNGSEGRRHNNRQQKEVNRTKAMVMVLGIFVLCWCPFLFYLLTELFFLESTLGTNTLKACFRIIALMNSGINWLIYGGMNKRFRLAFKQIFSCCVKRGPS